ncbi:MAG: glycosyltransferase [Halomonadaceae bacterium]|jgi:glycosyltransferase involved in cell wall biosynthesis
MKTSLNSCFPPFSVLLSVYEKEKVAYLDQAIASIWDHQTLKPSQIVIVKDGPLTRQLDDALAYWASRLGDTLTILSLPHNVGLGAALNAGLKACKYELVARMDTDDVSLPQRFEKQVAFMETHPEIAAASAQVEEWDEEMRRCIGSRLLPLDSMGVARFAKRRCPLSHPASIYRGNVILELGGYPELRKAQDYALWSLLLCNGYRLANLPDTLLKMRAGDNLISRRGWSFFKKELALLRYQRKIGFLGLREYLANVILRAALRLLPPAARRLAYKHAR